mgnify:CR=1 FL=1
MDSPSMGFVNGSKYARFFMMFVMGMTGEMRQVIKMCHCGVFELNEWASNVKKIAVRSRTVIWPAKCAF